MFQANIHDLPENQTTPLTPLIKHGWEIAIKHGPMGI